MSRCPACTSLDVAETLTAAESMFGSGERFSYALCAGCGTARLLDPPADLSGYYPRDYYSVADDPEVLLGRPPARWAVTVLGRSALRGGPLARLAGVAAPVRQVRTLMSLLASVRRCPLPPGRPPRVLDVGAGSGALVYALSLAGVPEPLGVDPYAPGDRVLDTGARLLARHLDDVEEDGWDLVMLHHSLEHVPDPEAVLRQAVRRLAPGGSLLVRMPTVSSAAFARYREHWVQLDPPRHLWVPSRPGVAALAERVGLRVVRVDDDATGFQSWGSEQLRSGTPLMAETSHMTAPRRSAFRRRQLARWEREARRHNAAGRGDQAAWVLQPV